MSFIVKYSPREGPRSSEYQTRASAQVEPTGLNDPIQIIQGDFGTPKIGNRLCGGNPMWIFFVRKEARELKAIKREDTSITELVGKARAKAAPVLDLIPQPAYADWDSNLLAMCDTEGRITIFDMRADKNSSRAVKSFAELPKNSSDGCFIKSEWIDPETLVAIGDKGSVWIIQIVHLSEEFEKLNAKCDAAFDKIKVEIKESSIATQIPAPRGCSPVDVATTLEEGAADRRRIIAIAGNPDPASVMILHGTSGMSVSPDNTLTIRPDGTPVEKVAFLGSELFHSLCNIIVTVSNNSKTVRFFRITNKSQLLFSINLSPASNEWENKAKLFLEAEGNTVVLSASGRQSAVIFKLNPSRDGSLSLSVDEMEITNSALLSCNLITFGMQKASKNPPELLCITTKKLMMGRLGQQGPGDVEQEPRQPPAAQSVVSPTEGVKRIVDKNSIQNTVPEIMSPPVKDKMQPVASTEEPKHEILEQRQRRRSPQRSKQPDASTASTNGGAEKKALAFDPPSAVVPIPEREMGSGLYNLQKTLQNLQVFMNDSHSQISKRLDSIKSEFHQQEAEQKKSRESIMKVIESQSSDIQQCGQHYYSRSQASLNQLHGTIKSELQGLSSALRAPAEKLVTEMDKSNEKSIASMNEGMETCGEEIRRLLCEKITNTISSSQGGGSKSLSVTFSEEVRIQLTAMLERRLSEISDYQVRLEIDFARILDDMIKNLTDKVGLAKNAAANEVGKRLALYDNERDAKLHRFSDALEKKFDNIAQSMRQLGSAHEASRETLTRSSEFPRQASIPAAPQPPSSLDIFRANGQWSQCVDLLNGDDDGLSKFRSTIASPDEIVKSPDIDVSRNMVLLRNVFIAAGGPYGTPEVSAKWLRSLVQFFLRTTQAVDPQACITQLDWGLSRFEALGQDYSQCLQLTKNIRNKLSR